MSKSPRTRRRRKDARPDEILSASHAEFAEKGFAHSTMAGIAMRAGISRSTIYLYYDTKEDILEAALRATIERTIDDLTTRIAGMPDDFRASLTEAIDIIYARLVEGDAAVFMKILIAESHLMPDLVSLYRREILSKGEAVIRMLVDRGVRSGELPESARHHDVRVVVAPAITAAIWGQVFGTTDPLDLEVYKRTHLDLVIAGLTHA